jgi:hypothetical protein
MIGDIQTHISTTQWSASMSEDGQLLWRINNEYRSRLTKALNSFDLLLHLLQARTGVTHDAYLDTLYYVREQLAHVGEEHRSWRYRHYYEQDSDKRMVQDDRSIQRALSAFSRMASAHQRLLVEVGDNLSTMQRPDALLTAVANGGDLWEIARQTIGDLANFDGYVRAVAH